MSAVDYAEYQRRLQFVEADEARRRQLPLSRARHCVARALGLPPGTLEGVRRGRLKELKGRVERAIDDAFTRALEREVERLINEIERRTNELEMARERGLEADRRSVATALASLDEMRVLLAERPK